MEKSHVVEFSGLDEYVTMFWRELVELINGLEPSPVRSYHEYGLQMGKFTVALTEAERQLIDKKLWGKKVQGETQTTWNTCVTYHDTDPKLERESRRRSARIERALNR